MKKNLIKFLPPEKAVFVTAKEIEAFGFYRVGTGKTSAYMSRRGTGLKIRISDHKHNSRDPAVIAEHIFDYPTIENDAKYQAKKLVTIFDNTIRNRKNKADNIRGS